MTQATLDLLRCPCGAGPLRLENAVWVDRRVSSGVLECDSCKEEFRIEDGIALLISRAVREPAEVAERKESEKAARDSQVGQYDRMMFLKLLGRVEIPMTLKRLALRPQDVILEAGCGTGRMTSHFALKARHVVAADFSLASLKANAKKLHAAGFENVDLVQADVCALPFQDDRFDRTVSCQVLEHVPSDEGRKKAVGEFARVTKEGGRVVVSAYQHSLLTRFFGQKQGLHDGGIYFFRFSQDEFRSLLSTALSVRSISGVLIYIHLAVSEKVQRKTNHGSERH